MSDRWSRLAPLTGIIFAVLFVAGFAISSGTPDVHASGLKVIAFYKANHGSQFASDILTALGAAFLLFFAASLRAYLRRVEGTAGLATLGLAGAVVLAIGLASFASLDWALTDARNTLDSSGAQTLSILTNDFFFPAVIGTSVWLIGNGLAIARTAALPKWLGWVVVVLAIVGFSPVWFFTFFAVLAWSVVVSVLIYLRSAHAPAAGEPSPAGAASP